MSLTVIRYSIGSIFCVLAAAGTAATAFAQAGAGAPSNSADESGAAVGLPGLVQPGDDPAEVMQPADSAGIRLEAESLSWYMSGLGAERRGDFDAAREAFEKAAEAAPRHPEPLRALTRLLMRLRRIPEAERTALQAIALDQHDYETRFQLALIRLARRDVAAATDLLEQALTSERLERRSAEFVRLHSIRGQVALQTNDAARAAESYGVIFSALERPEDFGLSFQEHRVLMSDESTGYERVGRVMLQLGDNEKAIAAFEALARTKSNEPGAHHLFLAGAYFRLDRPEESLKALDLYFRSGRREQGSLQLLSDILSAQGRSDDLVDRLRELAESGTDRSAVRMFLGRTLVSEGRPDEAEEVFRELLSTTGDSAAWLGLVRVDVARRNAVGLLETLTKALRARIRFAELEEVARDVAADSAFADEAVSHALERLSDDVLPESEIPLFFASVCRQTEDGDREEQLLREALKRNPEPVLAVSAMDALGTNLLARDQFAESSAVIRQLLQIQSITPGMRISNLYRLSFAEALQDRFAEAESAVRSALELAQENPELTYQLGWIQAQADSVEDAERTLKKAVILAENDPRTRARAWILLGSLMAQESRWDDSIRAFESVIRDNDTDEESRRRARMLVSNSYLRAGDTAASIRVLEEVYTDHPDDPGVNNDLGYLYADQNMKLEQAEQMIRKALAAEPDNVAYQDSLGWVLFRLQKYEEALTVLEKATSDPDYQDSTIVEHLGDVQNALGRGEQAIETWKRALGIESDAESPDSEVVERLEQKIKNPPVSGSDGGDAKANGTEDSQQEESALSK